MKRLLLLSIILLTFSSCALLKVLKIVNKDSILEKEYYHVIPFESQNNMVLVKVSIKGTLYDFIFDTGAFTVLSDKISDKLKLVRLQGPKILDSQGNKQSIDFTVPDTISLNDLDFIKPGCGIYNFSSNQELSCFSFQGILGANMFKDAVCQVNFKNKTLIITNDINKLTLSNKAVELDFIKHITGQPIVKMKIDGIKVKNIILDYGSGSGFNLSSSKLIKKIEKEELKHVNYRGYNAVGLFGKKEDENMYYLTSNLSIEKMKLNSELIILSRDGISTIGVEFLKNYIVSLDFRRQKVYFEPEFLEESEGLRTFGMTPVLADKKLIVSGVFNPSPAMEAGIKEGDEIISIDDKKYSDISREEYCEILKNGIFPEEKDTAEIKIKSDNITREIKLIKKDLFK